MFRIFILLFFFFYISAGAAPLQEEVRGLQLVPVNYGANDFKVAGKSVLITKGYFASDSAWGRTGYSILLKEKNNWQFARVDDSKSSNEVIIWDSPHTSEDAIKSVVFLISGNNKNITKLFILTAERHYNESPLEAVPANFVLYGLEHDNDFGIWYVKKIASETTAKSYCNSDSAIYHELQLPITHEGNCEETLNEKK